MPVFKATQVIDRPVVEVFAEVADAANYDTWNPTVTSARKLTAAGTGLGSRFEWTLRGFGKVVQEFGEFEENKRIRIVPHMRGMTGGHRFQFTEQGRSTRVEHELLMQPVGWFRLFSPFIGMIGRKNLRDTTTALKRHLENG
jgi:uncharacterized protein YndB with AHSA1/START domain